MFFEDNIDDGKYCGHLYGLGTSYVVNGSASNVTNNTQGGGSSSLDNHHPFTPTPLSSMAASNGETPTTSSTPSTTSS